MFIFLNTFIYALLLMSSGNDLILGVNWEGLMLIKPEDKFVLYEFRYVDIESLFLDPSDSFITVNLIDQGAHRCFVFETTQKTEIGSLIISYYPALAAWITEQEAPVSWSTLHRLTQEDTEFGALFSAALETHII